MSMGCVCVCVGRLVHMFMEANVYMHVHQSINQSTMLGVFAGVSQRAACRRCLVVSGGSAAHPAEPGHCQRHAGLELIRVLLAEAGDEGDGSRHHALEDTGSDIISDIIRTG